jgi:hypothetical protein
MKRKSNTFKKLVIFFLMSIIPLTFQGIPDKQSLSSSSSDWIPHIEDRLNITSPRKGDMWQQGDDLNITFVTNYFACIEEFSCIYLDVKLIYSGEFYEEWTITENWNELSGENWKIQTITLLWPIPETLPNGSDYKVLIHFKELERNLEYDYYSEIFTIGTISEGISGFPIIFFISGSIIPSLTFGIYINKKKNIIKKHLND